MSERFARRSHEETLERMQNRLHQDARPLDLAPEWRFIGWRLACPNSNHRKLRPMSGKKQIARTMRGDGDRLAITGARDD